MARRFALRLTTLALAAACVVAVTGASQQARLERLTDAEFWALVSNASESGGAFHSDNFTSNEPFFSNAAAALAKSGPGGAYMGVGPEQNFHYIAALRPDIAILFDIRRQAVIQHLLFKALFELSDDRAQFISRLFSLPVPSGVDRKTPIGEMWEKFGAAPGTDKERLASNLAAVKKHLTGARGMALSDEDLKLLEYLYDAFFRFGPAIDYAGGRANLTPPARTS